MTRFKPGQSGNPSGRPKGSISLINRKRELMARHVPEIVQAINNLAVFGDVQTLTNCLRMAIEAKTL